MKILTLILIITFLLILSPVFGQWEYHVIDNLESYTSTVVAKDIDNDGDNDLLVSAWNNILLYLNNNLSWTKITVDTPGGIVIGVDMADFDKDGYTDIIAANEVTDVVVWYKNDGGNPVNWILDTIDIVDFGGVAWAEDINGDGAIDVVANNFNAPKRISWYENNLPAGWIKHIIGSNHCGDYSIADINKDGKPDIVGGNGDLNNVVLYQNNLPDTNWTEIIIDSNIDLVYRACAGDIDNDGDMDVAGCGGTYVIWYENDGSELTWTKHTISTDMVDARYVDMADKDNDGYMDLVVSDPNANKIILFKNEDGGQNWTEIIIDENYKTPNGIWFADVDLDGDFDITPSERSAYILVWYENHSPGTAYPESMEVNPFSIQSQNDTLTVLTGVNNPENHTASAFAVIQGEQFTFIDTLQLFDDGLHHDGDASDNIWGNIKLATGLPEDSYTVDIFTYDSIFDVQFDYHPSGKFITFGSVLYEKYVFDVSDTEPNPGDRVKLELTLKNNSLTATATSIIAKLVSLDPLVSVLTGNRSYDDIPAGENSTPETYTIEISEECPGNKEVQIVVNISSYDNICWSDTFSITILEPVNLEDIREPITRIYPNPTDKILNIEISNTDRQAIEIEIFTITGKVIYRNEYKDTNADFIEQLDLSGYSNGVYLIKVRHAATVYFGKVVLK